MKIVTKPWGKEEWLELNPAYCYKRIYINAGHKTSYQYHNFKYETNYIISGEAEIWLENDIGVVEKKIMKEGEFFNVPPPKKHRVIALTDLILQEVSTPEGVGNYFHRTWQQAVRGENGMKAESSPEVAGFMADMTEILNKLQKKMMRFMEFLVIIKLEQN